MILHQNKDQTIDKYSKSQKVKIFLSTTGIPSNIRVPFGQEHWTALKSTSSQIFHNLETCEYI